MILDQNYYEPAINPEFINTYVGPYWSSTSAAGSLATTYGWPLNFRYGRYLWEPKTQAKNVRCVRGGLTVPSTPIAVNDTAITTISVPVTVSVLANDIGAEGDTLSVTSATNGSNGTVVVNGDSTVTYTPNAEFSGSDSFTYTISDGNGGSDTGTVTINVGSGTGDLVLHWQFEEMSGTIAGDSSGNNINGTLYNGPVWNNNAAVGNGALTFDGINDYVSADSPSLDFGSNDFTVSIWVKKLESSGSGWDNVWGVSKWNSGANPGSNEWSLALGDGGNDLPVFAIESGTTVYQINGSEDLTIGQWHHITGVRVGNEIQLYVDGQLEGTKYVGTASINNVGRNLQIANSVLNAYQTNGTFDDLRIYSRALSESEIQDIMNGTTPVDTTAPIITLDGSTPVNVVQGSTYTDAGATAIDNVDGDITANIVTVNPVDTNTVGIYTVTYDVTDAAGNAAQQVTRTVNVVAAPPVDTTAPIITLDGSTPVNVVQGSTYTDAGATAIDNVDGDITANIVTVNPVDTNTVGIYTVTYDVTDAAGNAAQQVTRTVNVVAAPPVDTTAPIITLDGSTPVNVVQGSTYTDAGATAIDNVDGDITANIVTVNPVDTNTVGIYTVTYDVTDAAGNAAQQVTRTVNVVVGSGTGDLVLHWQFEEMSGTIAGDSSGNNINGTLYNGPVWNNNAAVGNGALTFDGINDYVSADSPSLDFGSNDFTVSIWVKKLESSGSGWDNVWGVSKWNSGANPGSNEWSLALGDGGNDLPVFAIESGTTVYQINGSEDLTIGQWHHITGVRVGNEIQLYVDGQLEGTKYVGTASINNVGRNLQIANSVLNAYQTNGTFDDLRIYSRALSESEIQDIMNGTTPVDTTAPIITLDGSTPVNVVQGSTYTDAGATAIDNVDGDITANIVTVNPVDTNTVGIYTVTYDVTDAAGNAAQQVTRTVNVVAAPPVDTTAPIITLDGSTPVNVVQGSTYTDAGATAIDNVDGDITANIVTVNPVDTNTVGIYTVTYDVTDAAGNAAQQVTRTVNVVAAPPVDTTAPIITLDGSTPVNVVQGSTYTDAGATAIDNVDGDITANIVTVNPVDTNTVGIYTVTYDVTDAAGNAAQQVTRTVNVVVGSGTGDLVLHWQFEEMSGTITGDSSGNNINGTLYNGPVWNNNAAVGNGALTFDGINDYVSADSPSLDFGSNDFTVSIWVKKLESSGSGWDNVWGVSKWNSGANPGSNEWSLALGDGGNDLPVFAIESGTTVYQINGSEDLTIGQWHHITGVRVGNEIQLYVDGQLEGTKYVGTASINNVGRNLQIANSVLNAYQTNGTFDDLRIYSRALSESEIQDIMNGTTPPE